MKSHKKIYLFINFEGIDNSGKSTLIADIQKELSKSLTIHITKELTTNVGLLIKKKLKNKSLDSYEKVLLFAADRQRRYSRHISPKLKSRCLFLSDRWFFSAIAYRCAENSSIREYVTGVNKIFVKPDFTFYIDITARESIRRGKLLNKNNYPQSFLNKVRKEYLSLAEEYDFTKIDGMREYDSVKDEVVNKIKEIIKNLIKYVH